MRYKASELACGARRLIVGHRTDPALHSAHAALDMDTPRRVARFRIPAETAMADAARAFDARSSEAGPLRGWAAHGGTSEASGALLKILIVDRDACSAEALKLMLRVLGYTQIRIAQSGRAALTVAAGFDPDVVLLELDLPDASGYEVARMLREHTLRPNVRLIALTLSREHTDRERARVAGFERYLLKPVTALDLRALLQLPAA